MRAKGFMLGVLAIAVGGCQASSAAVDGGDAGPRPVDGGTDGGCAVAGASCDPVLAPCCDPTEQCLLVTTSGLICSGPVDAGVDAGSPDAGPDAGLPDSGADAGGNDAGGPDSGPPADAGPSLWVAQPIPAGVTALYGLAVPNPALVLAVGQDADGGLLVSGTGAADASFAEVPGVSPSRALSGVWSDPVADAVLLVGRQLQEGVLIEGSLQDGGAFQSITGTWTALGLLQCWGDDLGNRYAVGYSNMAGLVLLEPAAGTFAPETLPAGLATVFRITGLADGSTVYALAVDEIGASQILARVGGTWTELSGLPSGTHFRDLDLDPGGNLVVVGDDGLGDGVAYLYSADAGSLTPVSLPSSPAVPNLTAIAILPGGDVYLGAGGLVPFVLHGADGGWEQESLPGGVTHVAQLQDDGAGAVYAVGTAGSAGVLLKRSP